MSYEKQYFSDGEIITASQLNHIENGIVAASNVRNFLDNSNFLNPVNQRGSTSYTGNVFTIDRWRAFHSNTTHTVSATGLTVSSTGGNPNAYQVLNTDEIDVDKTYTAAAMDSDGNVYVWVGKPSNTAGTTPICVYTSGSPMFRLCKSSTTWVWAALYEGEYTVDTLPAYQPKGYAAELAECRRYFKRINISGLNSALGLFYYSSGEFALGTVFTDIEMVQKIIPDARVTFAGDLKLYGQNGAEHPVNAMTAVQSEGNILRIGIPTSGLTPGIYALRGTGYIDVSCDT